VIVVPQLCRDEDVLAFHDTFINGSFDTLARFFFVLVVVCSIEQAVADLDGIVDGFGRFVGRDLPESKADQWHLMAGSQFHC